jgi:tetratricopeptide (TPR) repeat protein
MHTIACEVRRVYEHYETSDDVFVDREEFIEWMDEALVKCKEKSVILHLKGIGGIGKSSLLKHWIKTKERTVRVDCEHYTEFYTRLNVLAKGAVLNGVNLQRFDVLWQIRQRFVEGVEPVKEEGREWAKDVVMAIPFIGSLAQIGNAIRSIGTQVTPKFKGKYSTVGKWLQDRLGKNHIEQLLEILWKEPRRAEFLYLDALLEDINNRKDTDAPLLFLLDHFEYVDSENARWRYQGKRITETELWSIFLCSLENCVGVMAGRRPAIKRDDLDFEETELTELDRESCIEMLELQGVLDEELQERIVSVSGGNPFVVDAICDMSEISNISIEDIESLRANTLEEVRLKTWKRLFSHAQDLLSLVDRAGLLPFFNREIMNIVAPDMKTDHWNRLLSLSFVIQRDDGNYVLHDLAEELVRGELGSRLKNITTEVAGLLEAASKKDDDLRLFGLSLSVDALAAPEETLEKLKRYYIQVANTPIYSKLLVMLDYLRIDTDIGNLFVQYLKGWSFWAVGRFADGEQLLRASLEGIRELTKDTSDEHLEYLGVFQLILACFLNSTLRLEEAEKEYREGFEILGKYRKKHGLRDPWIYTMYGYLLWWFGRFLVFMHQYEEAEEKLNEIILFKDDYLRVMKEFEPELSWSVLGEAYQQLAIIFGRLGRLAEAEEALRGALEGPLQPISRKVVLGTLFFILEKTGQSSEAEITIGEILRITRDLYEADPAMLWGQLVNALIWKASIQRKLGKHTDAQDDLEEAIQLAEQNAPSEGPNSDAVFWSLNEYGILQRYLGNYEKARTAHKKELEAYRLLFEKHPEAYRKDLVAALNAYALLQRSTGKLSESEEMYNDALVYLDKEVGDIISGFFRASLEAKVLNNLSLLMRETNRNSESEKTLSRALNIKRKLVDEVPENLLFLSELSIGLNNMGIIFGETNRISEAESVFRESLEICNKLVETSREYFLRYLPPILNNLGITLRKLNKPKEADELYEEAVSDGIGIESLGEEWWIIEEDIL